MRNDGHQKCIIFCQEVDNFSLGRNALKLWLFLCVEYLRPNLLISSAIFQLYWIGEPCNYRTKMKNLSEFLLCQLHSSFSSPISLYIFRNESEYRLYVVVVVVAVDAVFFSFEQ